MESSTSTLLNLADVIAGRAKVKQTQITNPMWVQIITDALADVRPRLEYLKGFTDPQSQLTRPAVFQLNDSDFSKCSFHVDSSTVGAFPQFETGTRWAEVARLAPSTLLPPATADSPYFCERRLLWTTKSEFYTWFSRCELRKQFQYNPEMWIRYFEVGKIDLAQLPLNEIQYEKPDPLTPCLGFEILSQAAILLRDTIQAREQHLGEMNRALGTLTAPSKWIRV